jgi:hypothetical protein
MVDQFHKTFYKDYQFWTLIAVLMTLAAMIYFAYQAQKTQSALKSIEEVRQKEKFCNDLQIHFNIRPSSTLKFEEAKYDLKLLNNSSHIFESLKTKVVILFENKETREMKQVEVFTFPSKNIPPSDKPIFLLENPQLTDTFRTNISEVKKSESKKNIWENFRPKCFYFFFKWRVNIGNGEYLEIHKRKYFLINQFFH